MPHAIGVAGQHEVLMVGLYTCDLAKVVSKSITFCSHTTHTGRSEKQNGMGTRVYLISTSRY